MGLRRARISFRKLLAAPLERSESRIAIRARCKRRNRLTHLRSAAYSLADGTSSSTSTARAIERLGSKCAGTRSAFLLRSWHSRSADIVIPICLSIEAMLRARKAHTELPLDYRRLIAIPPRYVAKAIPSTNRPMVRSGNDAFPLRYTMTARVISTLITAVPPSQGQ